jgi:hypothetical protein
MQALLGLAHLTDGQFRHDPYTRRNTESFFEVFAIPAVNDPFHFAGNAAKLQGVKTVCRTRLAVFW